MARMPNIEAEARQAADRILHPHADVAAMVAAAAPSPVTQEEPVSASRLTPAAKAIDDALKVLADAARHVAADASNPLIAQLDEEGLGLALKPDEVNAVLTLVRALEGERNAPQVQP